MPGGAVVALEVVLNVACVELGLPLTTSGKGGTVSGEEVGEGSGSSFCCVD